MKPVYGEGRAESIEVAGEHDCVEGTDGGNI